MSTCLPLLILALAAPPSETQLLKTFRSEFVAISPGTGPFPKTQKLGVRLKSFEFSDKFEISKFETTQELWEAIMGSNPSRWKGKRNSVENLTYAEVREFCRKATDKLRELKLIDSNESVRLPTETEWEYCTRAGTESEYSFEDPTKLSDYAWHTGNAAGNDPPVGAKKPNPWGLYDVHGYLWEWCQGDFKEELDEASDQETADVGVIRGGSWKDQAMFLQSSSRRLWSRDQRDDAVGFRCVIGKEGK